MPGDPGQFCVFSVKFSQDSRQVITGYYIVMTTLLREILGGANDGCLYVYDREINQQTSRIQAHKDDINAVITQLRVGRYKYTITVCPQVSFLDDSTHLLASGGDDGLVMVWDRCG